MLYTIVDKTGNVKIIAQDTENRTQREAAYCIKMAVDDEIRTNGGLDYNNLADSLHRNGFTLFGFQTVQVMS